LPANTFEIAIFTLTLASAGMMAHSEASPADASETYRTSCRGNDCVRYLCDTMGGDCFLLGYFDRREEIHQDRTEYGTTPDVPGTAIPDSGAGQTRHSEPHYHYKNHFDPDNDYDDPLG
jgi:hypothetical protein